MMPAEQGSFAELRKEAEGAAIPFEVAQDIMRCVEIRHVLALMEKAALAGAHYGLGTVPMPRGWNSAAVTTNIATIEQAIHEAFGKKEG